MVSALAEQLHACKPSLSQTLVTRISLKASDRSAILAQEGTLHVETSSVCQASGGRPRALRTSSVLRREGSGKACEGAAPAFPPPPVSAGLSFDFGERKRTCRVHLNRSTMLWDTWGALTCEAPIRFVDC